MPWEPPAGMQPVVLGQGRLNTADEQFIANIRHNIRLGLPQAKLHAPNDTVICLVAGGPSLAETEGELRRLAWNGAKIAAVNGAYQWLIDRNYKPSAAIMLDARPFNSRFFTTDVDGCKYFLASQCDPSAFENVKGREVYIWHAMTEIAGIDAELDRYYLKRYHKVVGGITVTTKALHLLRMCGFQYFEIFGFDSCLMGGAHHAYDQPENHRDGEKVYRIHCAGRTFDCTPWHIQQAKDFLNIVKTNGEMFFLNVHGDGLIAHMLKSGADAWRELEQAA